MSHTLQRQKIINTTNEPMYQNNIVNVVCIVVYVNISILYVSVCICTEWTILTNPYSVVCYEL